MKKRKVLIIYSYVFRDFDYFRYEIEKLEKNFSAEVTIHELIKIIHPNTIYAYKNFCKSKKIIRFDSYFAWKKEFRNIVKNNSNLLIIKDIQNSNFFSFLINLEINKAKRKVLEYSSSHGHPELGLKFKNIKLLNWLSIKKLILFFNNKIFSILGNLFKLYPNYCFKAGSKGFRNIYKTQKVIIIKANSFDYSNYITYKKEIQNIKKKKIAIFLDSPTPLYDGDNLLINTNKENLLTAKNWYQSLNIFFRNIEKLLDIKVKICLHPKVNFSKARYKYKKIFEGREILKKRPLYYLNYTGLIISRHSTGFSYAVISKIPSVVITSEELIKDNKSLNSQLYLAKELGVDIINVDDKFDARKIKKLTKINKKKYYEYKLKYLTSLNISKSNYKIIGENFLN
jgi:hypothetical protein